ncbi:hypothetical protein [Beijerinckia indica]|uniref:Uncharacterized protein n=1 Tax=Beijerinckia indica subsp. indica (strain ATCC 9039 / DSM 1715 / NCIMB 8712) TaxID=395963 RepID=B2ICF0_BEII9|nr:hypothetical protein [Beijerinckia indica]ACB96746.1 hypothetical protein Bind_3186 [Beijerinckia indica subsp. indica ATCC 9039]
MSELLAIHDKICKAKDLVEVTFMAVDWLDEGREKNALAAVLNVISDTLKEAEEKISACRTGKGQAHG